MNRRLTILTILVMVMATCIFITVMRIVDIRTQNGRQQNEIALMQKEILALQLRMDEMATKEALSSETEDMVGKLQELGDRIQPVEEDQKFYKDIWREYFGMKGDLP